MTKFDTQVNALNNDVDTFESSLKKWETDMIEELGENKIAVTNFNQEVGSTLETISKTMNSQYSITSDYHEKVRKSMDGLEKQVYKVVKHSKNFVPPTLPGD